MLKWLVCKALVQKVQAMNQADKTLSQYRGKWVHASN